MSLASNINVEFSTTLTFIRKNYEIGDMDTDIVENYIRTHSPVNPQTEGRITIDNNCVRKEKPTSCDPLLNDNSSEGTASKNDYRCGDAHSGGVNPELAMPFFFLASLLTEVLL